MLAVPILIQVYFNAGLAYSLNRLMGEQHCVAGPSALIGASNFFELAVAAAISLFGFNSGAACNRCWRADRGSGHAVGGLDRQSLEGLVRDRREVERASLGVARARPMKAEACPRAIDTDRVGTPRSFMTSRRVGGAGRHELVFQRVRCSRASGGVGGDLGCVDEISTDDVFAIPLGNRHDSSDSDRITGPGPMSTKMDEDDWAYTLAVFRACLPRRGRKAEDDRRFLEALHFFTVENVR